MAMIKCSECGKEISDKAEKCPNCGCPINQTGEKKEVKKPEKKRNSTLSTVSAFLALFTCTSPIGIITAVIDLAMSGGKEKKEKHIGSYFAIIWGFLFIIITFSSFFDNDKENTNIDINNSVTEQTESGEETKQQENNTSTLFDTGEIYNENNCIILVTDGGNKEINLEIQNNSDKNYSFDIHALSINGIMTNCNIYTASTDVPSNKRGKMQLVFSEDWLNGINNIEYIDVLFWVYDNSNSMKDFDTGIIRVKTNFFKDEVVFEKGKNVTETNGIEVFKNSVDDKKISYSIINRNEYRIETNMENCSLNGWAFEPGYSSHGDIDNLSISIDGKGVIIFPNSIANIDVDISEFVKENNIGELENFEFSLSIIPNEDYFQETETEKIVLEK